jgi:hypothetical protein
MAAMENRIPANRGLGFQRRTFRNGHPGGLGGFPKVRDQQAGGGKEGDSDGKMAAIHGLGFSNLGSGEWKAIQD